MKGLANSDYQPLNKYTTPIPGVPDQTNAGIIKALGRYEEKYSIARIDYQVFWNQEYQYIITPYWDIIDVLDPEIFQGIPGIAMELRLEKYYRVNAEPAFVTGRSPERNREDLQEMLEIADLDHYDRFEWLIQTPLRYGNDNLIVERYREETRKFVYERNSQFFKCLQYGDTVFVQDHCSISENPEVYTEHLFRFLAAGVTVVFEEENLVLDQKSRRHLLPVLRHQYYAAKILQSEKHQRGVNAARERGSYRGRKPIYVDEEKLKKIYELFHMKKITEAQAMKRLGITSRSTFYRKLKKVKEG